MKQPCVYIMASASRVLYTGVTGDLFRRVCEHRQGLTPGFTTRYRVTRLVHFELLPDMAAAIRREKQIKGWRRVKKVALIESQNPEWSDLAEGWFTGSPAPAGSSGPLGVDASLDDGTGAGIGNRCHGATGSPCRGRDSSLRSE